jgi:hypothetical protein
MTRAPQSGFAEANLTIQYRWKLIALARWRQRLANGFALLAPYAVVGFLATGFMIGDDQRISARTKLCTSCRRRSSPSGSGALSGASTRTWRCRACARSRAGSRNIRPSGRPSRSFDGSSRADTCVRFAEHRGRGAGSGQQFRTIPAPLRAFPGKADTAFPKGNATNLEFRALSGHGA